MLFFWNLFLKILMFYFRMSIKREKRVPTNFTAHFKYAVILTRKQPKFFEGIKGNILLYCKIQFKIFQIFFIVFNDHFYQWPRSIVFYNRPGSFMINVLCPVAIKTRVYYWSISYNIDQGLSRPVSIAAIFWYWWPRSIMIRFYFELF